MPIDQQPRFRNRLLSLISAIDQAAIDPLLERVELERSEVLERPHAPIDFVYFLEHGVASVTASHGKTRLEVGPFGSEGMSGLPLILGTATSPHETNVQIPGAAHRIESAKFVDLLGRNRAVHSIFLRYVHTFDMQTAQTLIAAATTVLEVRLARWILLLHDRVSADEINATHEFMAMMLSVRRPGVTVALHHLEGKGLIRSLRNKLVIRDRAGLERMCKGIYGVAEAEYERLFGVSIPAKN